MRRLKLLRYFTIYSLVAFILMGTAIVLFTTTHMKNDKINSIEQISHLTIHYIIEPEISSSDYSQALSNEKSKILDNKIKHTLEENNILEAVIWNNSKTIIYSSNKNIAEIQPINKKIFNQVLGGNYSYLITNLQYENRVIKVLKIYIPITINKYVVGIYEIIKPYDEIQMHMNQVTKLYTK